MTKSRSTVRCRGGSEPILVTTDDPRAYGPGDRRAQCDTPHERTKEPHSAHGTLSTPWPGWWNGRHGGLKILCPHGRAGSNPAPGTSPSCCDHYLETGADVLAVVEPLPQLLQDDHLRCLFRDAYAPRGPRTGQPIGRAQDSQRPERAATRGTLASSGTAAPNRSTCARGCWRCGRGPADSGS